jgi:mono/diheme cytochrome c family protein
MLFGLMASSPLLAKDAVDFARQIGPLFEARCIGCHRPNNAKGDLSLATRAALIESGIVVPGKPDESSLLEALTASDGKRPAMPKDGEPLTATEVTLVRRWITEGATWPESIVLREQPKGDASWWSLQPLRDATPPQDGHPIDAFIRARLKQERLAPSLLADRRTLIRRLYFDLLGLPPTPAAVNSFVADTDPDAWPKLADELLDSPHFGERWARHWLDIAHYADTHGFERDKRRDNAWRYRDYVIRSLNADKPYDRFLREQIAGDVLAPDNDDSVVATGFLSAGPWDFVGQVETRSPVLRRSARALDLDDMVTQVMTATMAMTVNCARCHDHKLDPITQAEYYQLVSVFAGLKRGDREISNTASENYNKEKQRLASEIDRAAFGIAELEGKGVDLADVVGGGNGFGTGRKGIGLDARSGKVQERKFGDLGNVKPGDYRACEYDFVDGVFVPANDETKISSTDLRATGLPENSGKAWDMIRNGPVASQYSTVLGEIDYNAGGHSMIGLHANAGITFDLRAIREATKYGELWFSTVAGYGGRTVEPSAEFRVLLDGRVLARGVIGRNYAVPIKFLVPTEARFLTFISTDGGNGYGHDQISFGDPRLAPAKPRTLTKDDQQRLAELRMQKQRLESERQQLGEPPVFYGVVAEQPPTVHVLRRGNPETPGEAVEPGTLSWSDQPRTFGSVEMPEGERRVGLANWITDPDNPLTARVIVNRLWHWHFGQGLVTTPSDFGFGGDKPSHPALLDWLAAELIRNNWRLKHIHRLIVTSKAYRSRSLELESQTAIDSDNRLLWRMNSRRLEAEAVRDAVLAVTGKLNRDMFGPGYRDFDYEEAYAPIYSYRTADAPDVWRRSVYRFLVRTTPQQFMTVLDCPDPANMTPKRNVTTTALQSLALFNNDFMLRQAGYFAERLTTERPDNVDAQITRAFELAFARSPEPAEAAGARQLVEQYGLLHLCRALFNASEFVVID